MTNTHTRTHTRIARLLASYLDLAARAAKDRELPVVISFTLETDGLLPTGQIGQLDDAGDGYTLYSMINCAHPTHFEQRLVGDSAWRKRVRGVRGNAYKCSHAELDAAEVLDAEPGGVRQ